MFYEEIVLYNSHSLLKLRYYEICLIAKFGLYLSKFIEKSVGHMPSRTFAPMKIGM